ncbi:MAG: ATP-binding protein, partial [Cyanobacteria bacterium P01_H01_bin.130]
MPPASQGGMGIVSRLGRVMVEAGSEKSDPICPPSAPMSHPQSSQEPNNGAGCITFKAVCDGLAAHCRKGVATGLTPLEHSILEAAWDQESYRIVAQRLYLTEGHVKDVASALWKRLTTALDLPLSKRTFRGLMEQHWGDRLQLQTEIPVPAKPSSTVTSWADAPAVDRFYGREAEQHTLKQWLIRDRCRLVALLGLGGIGKTVLATTVGRAIADDFEVVIWRSLINAPPVQGFLSRLLVFLTQSIPAPSIPVPATLGNDFETQLLTLLEVLQTHRCLIILDNVETVLAARSPSPDRSAFSESDAYDQLFRRLGEAAHQSCLLITSREKPQAIARLDGPHAHVRTLFLGGLTPASARALLEELQSFDASPEEWQRLIAPYQGHPLVLELLAKHIDEAFLGDVAAFLEQDQRIFGDLERLLQWHFERLSPPEQLLLYWLAVYRHPASLAQLRNHWRSPHALGSALQSLQRRLPLVRQNQGVTLQPVLLEYVTAQLITDASRALLQGDLAALDRVCLLQASAPDERRAIQRRVILRA